MPSAADMAVTCKQFAEFLCKPSEMRLASISETQPKTPRFSEKNAEVAQLVERRLPKPKVAGSKPVFRSNP